MSAAAAHVRSTATRRRFWRIVGVGTFVAGSTGGAVLYYRYAVMPDKQRKAHVSNVRPPVRRTRPYIAGAENGGDTNNNNILADLMVVEEPQHNLPSILFYAIVVFRSMLLFVRMVPVVWYAVLTYGFHLCGEQVLFEKLQGALIAMGPSYIKLGQWMATRPDFFPPSLCAALEKLYDDTGPHSWSHTEKLLRCTFRDTTFSNNFSSNNNDTGGDGVNITTMESPSLLSSPGDGVATTVNSQLVKKNKEPQQPQRNALYFLQDIERNPVNSGSIAQVHRAVLREGVDGIPAGTEMAIKVTHPHVRENIAADLVAMRWFVNALTFVWPSTSYFDLKRSVQEFSSLLQSQLDLRQECDNLQQFIYNFRDFSGVIFPKPLPSLCSKDVLIETFERGQPLQEIHGGENYADIAERGCHMFLKMLFEDNFVHSDLHPGNLILRVNPDAPVYTTSAAKFSSSPDAYYPDGKRKLRHELIVLDPGLATTLSKEERNNFISLFAAVACGDGKLGADLMLDNMRERPGLRRDVNREKFRNDMQAIFNIVSPENSDGFKLSKIQIGPVLGKIMNTLRKNNAPIDGNFASLVLTVIVGEGLGRKLMPDFNIFAEAAPYLVALLEDSELFFLASKLRETYGTTALLRDSVSFVRPERTLTYAEITAKKVVKELKYLWCKLTGKTA